MTKYSLETKLEAVRAYINGTESFRDLANKYHVNVSMVIARVWILGSIIQYFVNKRKTFFFLIRYFF
jgi:hypothetical protein